MMMTKGHASSRQRATNTTQGKGRPWKKRANDDGGEMNERMTVHESKSTALKAKKALRERGRGRERLHEKNKR